MEQIYTPKQDYKVLVRCFTYNQSKYIEDALNGFAMQQTNFPFVCLVMDDCSTDGEQEVVKVWMERECNMEMAEYIEIEPSNIILVPHKTNVNCTFAFYFLKQNLYKEGKRKMSLVRPWRVHAIYEAFCEGDDWWLSTEKLQKQFEIMESHPEIDMCACGTDCYLSGSCVSNVIPSKDERILTAEETIVGGGAFLATNSLVYRTSMFLREEYMFYRICSLDYFLQIKGALRGGIYFIPTVMSAYRLSADGSWNIENKLDKDKRFDNMMKVFAALEALDQETEGGYKVAIKSFKNVNYNVLYQQSYIGTRYNSAICRYTFWGKIKAIILFAKKIFLH